MLKRLVLAAVVGLGASTAALAQGAPANTDDCFKMSMDLFKTADAKKLPEDQRGKVEVLLEKMETHCDAKQFSEAQGVATDVKAMIK